MYTAPNGKIPGHLVMMNVTDEYFGVAAIKEALDQITKEPILVFDFGLRGLHAHVQRHVTNQGGCWVSFNVSSPLYGSSGHMHKCIMAMGIAQGVPTQKHLLLFSYIKPDAFQTAIAQEGKIRSYDVRFMCERTLNIVDNVPRGGAIIGVNPRTI